MSERVGITAAKPVVPCKPGDAEASVSLLNRARRDNPGLM